MAILRNAMLCLQQEQLPIFKDTILLVLEKVSESKIAAKDMLSHRELLCSSAKALISKEIEATQKSFDLEKIMD